MPWVARLGRLHLHSASNILLAVEFAGTCLCQLIRGLLKDDFYTAKSVDFKDGYELWAEHDVKGSDRVLI